MRSRTNDALYTQPDSGGFQRSAQPALTLRRRAGCTRSKPTLIIPPPGVRGLALALSTPAAHTQNDIDGGEIRLDDINPSSPSFGHRVHHGAGQDPHSYRNTDDRAMSRPSAHA